MKRLVAGIAFVAAGSVAAQEPKVNHAGTYYCKITAGGGIKQNLTTKQWEATTFDTSDVALKMVVTDTGETASSNFWGLQKVYNAKITDFGSPDNKYSCGAKRIVDVVDNTKIPIGNDGRFICSWFGSTYHVDLTAKRLMVLFEGGYMDTTDTNTDTPYVSVGKCDKIG